MDLNEAQKQGKLFLSDFLDFLEALGPWFISWSADDQSQIASQLARGDSHHCTGTECDQFILSMSPMVEWYSRLFSEWNVQPFLCCKFYHLDLFKKETRYHFCATILEVLAKQLIVVYDVVQGCWSTEGIHSQSWRNCSITGKGWYRFRSKCWKPLGRTRICTRRTSTWGTKQ